MQVISLFSGIGGFEIAAEWMGWDNVVSCEINDFGHKVLSYYWPNAYHHRDVKTLTRETIEKNSNWNPSDGTILVGGFPCQPYSMAGKRLGKEDERHLWPEMLRAIREIQPRWVVGENVSGLINWNGGMVFDEVQADLEAEGYSVIPFILPACGVNAPHRRDRVWFVAYRCGEPIEQNIERGRGKRRGEWAEVGQVNTTNGEQQSTPHPNNSGTGIGVRNDGNGQTEDEGRGEFTLDELRKVGGDVADTDRSRRGKDTMQSELRAGVTFKSPINSGTTNETENEKRQIGRGRTNRIIGAWDNFPTQPPVRCGNDELSGIVVRNIKPEVYGQISEKYTDKDLQEVWQAIQSEDVQRKIRGLYKIHEPGILLQVLQLCSPANTDEKGVSPFSEIASEKILRKLRKHGSFANSPQGRELEKQFRGQFADTLPYLSHEIALVAMEVERSAKAFVSWHRNESIKGYGNAVVPQVVYQIFKAIQQYEDSLNQNL